LLTQEAADEREMGRIREERREQGLDLVGELEPAELDELERTQVEAEPQYDRPPRDEFEAAERGDMESYMEFSRRRDRREQEAEKAAARVRRLQNAGY
jgi:hypothetical protein